MPKQVLDGALLRCSMGTAPSKLVVLTASAVIDGNRAAARITDHHPMVNILPFAMCRSPSNPAVAAATAATGILTPAPCTPQISGPWVPGSPTVLLASVPALNDVSACKCVWEGIIEVVGHGETTVEMP